jgi:hypothetical protein
MADAIVPQRVEVHAVRPSKADQRKLSHLRQERGAQLPDVAYVVKIYVELPLPDGLGHELWLGDAQVRKYSEFKGGVYFTITNPEQLAAFRGQKVRFQRPGEPASSKSEVAVPIDAAPAAGSAATKIAAGVAHPAVLPSEEEVLRE